MNLNDYLNQFNDFDDTYIKYKKLAKERGLNIGQFNYLVIDRGLDYKTVIEERVK